MSKIINQWKIGDKIDIRGPFGTLEYVPGKVLAIYVTRDQPEIPWKLSQQLLVKHHIQSCVSCRKHVTIENTITTIHFINVHVLIISQHSQYTDWKLFIIIQAEYGNCFEFHQTQPWSQHTNDVLLKGDNIPRYNRD